jgi:hypothetical protein
MRSGLFPNLIACRKQSGRQRGGDGDHDDQPYQHDAQGDAALRNSNPDTLGEIPLSFAPSLRALSERLPGGCDQAASRSEVVLSST